MAGGPASVKQVDWSSWTPVDVFDGDEMLSQDIRALRALALGRAHLEEPDADGIAGGARGRLMSQGGPAPGLPGPGCGR